ncbi:MAG: single-stranded DNA-binding protein [Chloroflexota bacterium]
MGSVNKVIIVGNLGADPELRYTAKGTAVCHLSVATHASYKDSEGNRQDKTAWHKVVAWGKQGELCKQYLSKGRQIYIEGRLQTSAYTDNAGAKRYSTEVVSNSVVFLGANGRREHVPDDREHVPDDREPVPDDREPVSPGPSGGSPPWRAERAQDMREMSSAAVAVQREESMPF